MDRENYRQKSQYTKASLKMVINMVLDNNFILKQVLKWQDILIMEPFLKDRKAAWVTLKYKKE